MSCSDMRTFLCTARKIVTYNKIQFNYYLAWAPKEAEAHADFINHIKNYNTCYFIKAIFFDETKSPA